MLTEGTSGSPGSSQGPQLAVQNGSQKLWFKCHINEDRDSRRNESFILAQQRLSEHLLYASLGLVWGQRLWDAQRSISHGAPGRLGSGHLPEGGPGRSWPWLMERRWEGEKGQEGQWLELLGTVESTHS